MLARTIALAMAIYHIWLIIPPFDTIHPVFRMIFPGPPGEHIFRGTHLLFAVILTFLWFRWRSPNEEALAMMLPEEREATLARFANPSLFDWALLVAAVTPLVYLFVNYDYVIDRTLYIDDLTPTDMILGVTLLVVVLEATRRLMGWALPITALVFLAYALLIAKVEPMRLIDQLLHVDRGHLRPAAGGVGVLRDDLRAVRRLHGEDRHRPAVHGFCHEPDRPHRRRSRQGVGHFVVAVRHHLRLGGGQRDGRRPDHHPADEAHRLPAALRRRASRPSPPPAARSCRRSWAPPPS